MTRIKAKFVQEGDTLVGLDGYVFEDAEESEYLSYPRTSYGASARMPEGTVLIGYHDSEGNECYLLLPGDSLIEIDGPERDMDDE